MNVFQFVALGDYEQRDGDPAHVLRHYENGVVLTLHHIDRVPERYCAPSALEDARTYFSGQLAREGGALIETEVASVNGLPAIRQVFKIPRPDASVPVAFLGAYIIPRATCSAMVQLEAAEHPVTGARELAVLDELGYERCFQPHPYAPELDEGRGFNTAYTPEWDARFPEHPLTLVRTELAWIMRTLRLTPEFKALPPFKA